MAKSKRSWAFILLALVLFLATPPENSGAQEDPLDAYISTLTTQEKVGQLILVTFYGSNVSKTAEIAELIQHYRIGGVMLSPARENFTNEKDAMAQVRSLASGLQALALENPVLPATQPPVGSVPGQGDIGAIPADTAPNSKIDVHPIPLFIAVQQDGDGNPYTAIRNGVASLPSNMALGATWNPELAWKVGMNVGAELASAGVNMLLGPSLDVLQRARPDVPGDIGVRAFGGDPFWVGEMAQAYISGIHQGSGNMVLTVAKHFPGLGSSDRSATEEVATVQKSLQELRQIELAPFFSVTAVGSQDPLCVTDAMMTSPLIRYRGFQGNIRQLTRPIGLDADGLTALMGLPEFSNWRESGLLVSGPLGLPAVRKFYDPEMQSFQHKRIAYEALMAGNDIIFLADFSLNDDDWQTQLVNMRETLDFFVDRYESDAAFRMRVDNALRRILLQKQKLYPDFALEAVTGFPSSPDVKEGESVTLQVAQDALTLIYPGPEELADRLPGPPLQDEAILVFTDVRPTRDCDTCPEFSTIPERAFEQAVLDLYGPRGSAQIPSLNIHSASFEALKKFIEVESSGAQMAIDQERLKIWIEEADWLIFIMQDVNLKEAPYSDALKLFLKQRSDWMRNKKLIVFCVNAPYFLDTTEVSKLTAYYALYSKTGPFIETAARALFRELPPKGAPPVSVQAMNYDLITQLEPNPAQVIQISVVTPGGSEAAEYVDVKVGSTLTVNTSAILDRNGHLVPDGTPVQFRLYYPGDSLELPRQTVTTVDGVAETSITLERGGQLEVSAFTTSGTYSTTLVVSIQGDEPATIATIVPPTVTPEPTSEPTIAPSATATMDIAPTATSLPGETPVNMGSEPSQVEPASRASQGLFAWGLIGVMLGSVLANLSAVRRARSRVKRVRLLAMSMILGLLVYCAYVLGFIPLEGIVDVSERLAAALVGGLAALLPGLVLFRGGGQPLM